MAGKPDKVQDIYALACLTYEMLTGDPPYTREAALHRSPGLMPPKPQELTEAAWEVLKSGFAYRKEERPKSAGDLVRRLETAQAHQAIRLELPPVQYIHGWSPEKVKALQKQTAEAMRMPVAFRDPLKDGSLGPEMVVVPAGEFLMGSPENEEGRYGDEHQHRVVIERPFAIGKYAVTFEEYDCFAEATGREKPNDQGWGRGRRPVINVSWEDAVAYSGWLSEKTGQKYCLPTEAEWEYAARAGTVTPFHFGTTISTDLANYHGDYTYAGSSRGEYRRKTVEVGDFPPNAWGLHEVHGNVWEWTCSGYDKNYGGAEQECASKYYSGQRVVRGGSWDSIPRNVRSADRDEFYQYTQITIVGFRLARSL